MKSTIAMMLAVGLATATSAFGQNTSHEHGAGHDGSHGHRPAAILTEPGQGAFAALSEIVSILEADPDTDWTKVDIGGLRDHLMDMDLVVTQTASTETDLANGITIAVTGDGAALGAIHRMVPTHARELAKDDRWTVEASQTPTGAKLTVKSDDDAAVSRIQALGFYGLMASQDHHRAHHYGVATGDSMH